MMMRLRRHPAVHFIVAGAAIFAATRWIEPPSGVLGANDPHRIVIGAAQIESLRARERMRGGLPDDGGLDALVEAAAVDEMLYREALARGLDDDDAVVERRLVQDMRFLADDPQRDDAALLRQAEALGLQSGDPVIRRRLIQKMRFALIAESRLPEPTDDEVRRFFEQHGGEFAEPPRVRLSHIFFGGAEAENKAATALAELKAVGAGAEAAGAYGEPFLAGSELPPAAERGLAKLFGDEFARACMSLPAGRWSAPLRSAHGVHLVWIRQREAGASPSYEMVRERVRRRLEAERAAAALNAGIAELRAAYRIEVAADR
jgi:parvulin-like peptidyl-prolyl isomerase